MSEFDAIGDRIKHLERIGAGSEYLIPGLPVVARLDGRGFHTFTKGLAKPYDQRLSELMVETTRFLVKEFNASIGYCQSDEISLAWRRFDWFDRRITKASTIFSAAASAFFNRKMVTTIPEKQDYFPQFDCRLFSAIEEDATLAIVWRELDATKNAISMAAHAYFEHDDLEGLNSNAKQEKLFQEMGINFNDYPDFFKRGTYVRWKTISRPYTVAEIQDLPPKHHARTDSNLVVTRRVLETMNVPPISKVVNQTQFLLYGHDPVSQ